MQPVLGDYYINCQLNYLNWEEPNFQKTIESQSDLFNVSKGYNIHWTPNENFFSVYPQMGAPVVGWI